MIITAIPAMHTPRAMAGTAAFSRSCSIAATSAPAQGLCHLVHERVQDLLRVRLRHAALGGHGGHQFALIHSLTSHLSMFPLIISADPAARKMFGGIFGEAAAF